MLFKDAEKHDFKGFDADYYETIEKGHGRVEVRKYRALDASSLPSTAEWRGFQTAGKLFKD